MSKLELAEKFVVQYFYSIANWCFSKTPLLWKYLYFNKILSRKIFHFFHEISDKNLYPMTLYAGSCQDFFQSAIRLRGESDSMFSRRTEGLSIFKGYLWPDSSPVLIKFRFQSITQAVQDSTESQRKQVHACSENNIQSSVHDMQNNVYKNKG